MKIPVTAAALLLLSACAPSEPEREQLFNGVDSAGWRHTGPGEFVVEDGARKTVGGMGLLAYDGKKIGNAVVRVVYKPESPNANAGVFIRIPEKPHDPWFAVHRGYEVQIQDSGDELHRTGSIYSLSPAEEFPAAADGWNTMEIVLDGRITRVVVNGKQVNEFHGDSEAPPRNHWYEPRRGPRPDAGYIGLQNHDGKSTVWFREVSVRPLDGAR